MTGLTTDMLRVESPATILRGIALRSVNFCVVAVLTVFSVLPVRAQGRRNHNENLCVQVLNNLSFGTVVIGRDFQKRIPFTNNDAARALIDGLSHGESISMMFYLPSDLFSGGHRLQIQFDGTSAAWSQYNDPANATSFNPNSTLRLSSAALMTGRLYLWLGGTIQVSPQQASGQYGGDIRVQVNIDHDDD